MFHQHGMCGGTIVFLAALTPSFAYSQSSDNAAGPSASATSDKIANVCPADCADHPPAPERTTVAPVFGSAVGSIALEKMRGGTDTVNDAKLNGTVADNSAVNVSTGSNSISAGSFANLSGIPIVIQNSGANVLIQNSTIINLQLH